MLEKLINIIFPKMCMGCGKEETVICKICSGSIQIFSGFICPYCFRKSYFGKTCNTCKKKYTLDGLWVVCEYKALVRKMILALKFKNIQELKSCFEFIFQKYFFTVLDVQGNAPVFDNIVPIPLHQIRHRYRGFNQSEFLADIIGLIINVPVQKSTLRKIRNTRRQAVLNKKRRYMNLQDAFIVNKKENVQGKSFLLIDDVATTGATLEECAKTLKVAGAKTVWAIVFARGK